MNEPQTLFAVRVDTADSVTDITDLSNKVMDTGVPTAIILGSAYLVGRKLISDHSEKQSQLQEQDYKFHKVEKRKRLYQDFLANIAREVEYESGKFTIKKPTMLSKNLHSWHDLASIDLPSNIDILCTNFLDTLDKLIRSQKQVPSHAEISIEESYETLEKYLKELKQNMRKDVQNE